MNRQLLRTCMLLFTALMMPLSLLAISNNYGYKGTIEIKVGETKTIWLIDDVRDMIYLSTTYYPSGKWVLSNNSYNATMISQSMEYCKVRGDKKGDNIKLTFSGDMILYDAMWDYTGYYLIKVVDPDIPVEKITLDATDVKLSVKGTQQLSATISPSNATNKSVTWSSNKESVAAVSSSGLVTAKAAGSATITCKANDGSGKYATCSVTVSAADPIKVTGISINNKPTTMIVGDTRQLSATITPSNATDKSVTWSSSNSGVVSVNSNGLLTALARGSATITCKANDGSGVKATCDITVSSVKDYSTFTAKTIEGVEMTFYVSKVSSGVCQVAKYNQRAIDAGTTGKITIPEEVEGLKVTSIYSSAFRNCTGITELVVPKSVESIGSYVFEGCTALTSVALGNGVKILAYKVFYGCSSLQTITGISQLEDIDSYVFNINDNTYIPWYNSLPDGLLYLGKVLYNYKGTMPDNTTVNIKEGTVKICDRAFSDCKGLVGITIPQSVKSLGILLFDDCVNLESISVATGNEKYDSRNNCNAIVETKKNMIVAGCKGSTFPSTVTSIDSWAFYGSGLTNLVIPNNIDSVASSAFAYNQALKSVIIGKGTRKIVENPFYGCLKINSINVVTNNPYYDSRDNCNAIIEKGTDKLIVGCNTTTIPVSTKCIGYDAFYNLNAIKTITIPDNVETIENYAFPYLYNLQSLTIGKNVKQIDKNAFRQCYKLSYVRSLIEEPFDLDESVFQGSGNAVDSVYNNATLYVPIGAKINYMTTVGWNKFKKIVELADNEDPEGLIFTEKTPEGNNLIYQVTSKQPKTCQLIGSVNDLTGTFTIPNRANGYDVTALSDNAFYSYYQNHDFTEVSIPNSVKDIGIWAFEYCKLTSFTLPSNVTNIGWGILAYNPVTSLAVEAGNPIYDSRGNCNAIIETASNKLVVGCATTKIPSTVTDIGRCAFYGLDAETISIPNGVKTISPSAFNYSTIKSVTIPNSVDSIGNYAFGSAVLASVYSQIERPFEINPLAFSYYSSGYHFTDATLYVPIGTKALYETTAGWDQFKQIVEYDPSTDIRNVKSVESNNTSIYSLSGQRLQAPKKGINIIGGKKVVIK